MVRIVELKLIHTSMAERFDQSYAASTYSIGQYCFAFLQPERYPLLATETLSNEVL